MKWSSQGSDWILENKSLSGCKWGKNLAVTEEESGVGVGAMMYVSILTNLLGHSFDRES